MRACALIVSAATLLFSTIAHADSTGGTVAAFDRVDSIIVLKDKTIWDVAALKDKLPEGLKAGDKITIDYNSAGDSGVGKLIAITRNEG